MVKELQSLALDIKVLDEAGEEIQLETLCAEEEENNYSKRQDDTGADEVLGKMVEDDDVEDNFLVRHADDGEDYEGDEYESEESDDSGDLFFGADEMEEDFGSDDLDD
jgi:DNA-directed RNA polymerase subunit beta